MISVRCHNCEIELSMPFHLSLWAGKCVMIICWLRLQKVYLKILTVTDVYFTLTSGSFTSSVFHSLGPKCTHMHAQTHCCNLKINNNLKKKNDNINNEILIKCKPL